MMLLYFNFSYRVDYNEMSVRYGPVKLSVPTGFKQLLENLCREVLREQPKDIPKFAAVYFSRILEKREGTQPLLQFTIILWLRNILIIYSFCSTIIAVGRVTLYTTKLKD